MKVRVLSATPLTVCSYAIRTCWDSHSKSDSVDVAIGDGDKALIDRIGNKMKHESVKNHVTINFVFEDVTTKTLLALTRHDIGTEFSVQSTRYTTKKSVKSGKAGYTKSKDDRINTRLDMLEQMIIDSVNEDIANDEISLLLPQAWRYNLVCSMSITAIQHFLKLRKKKDAHWDIQDLAYKIEEAIPEDYIYLFED